MSGRSLIMADPNGPTPVDDNTATANELARALGLPEMDSDEGYLFELLSTSVSPDNVSTVFTDVLLRAVNPERKFVPDFFENICYPAKVLIARLPFESVQDRKVIVSRLFYALRLESQIDLETNTRRKEGFASASEAALVLVRISDSLTPVWRALLAHILSPMDVKIRLNEKYMQPEEEDSNVDMTTPLLIELQGKHNTLEEVPVPFFLRVSKFGSGTINGYELKDSAEYGFGHHHLLGTELPFTIHDVGTAMAEDFHNPKVEEALYSCIQLTALRKYLPRETRFVVMAMLKRELPGLRERVSGDSMLERLEKTSKSMFKLLGGGWMRWSSVLPRVLAVVRFSAACKEAAYRAYMPGGVGATDAAASFRKRARVEE